MFIESTCKTFNLFSITFSAGLKKRHVKQNFKDFQELKGKLIPALFEIAYDKR